MVVAIDWWRMPSATARSLVVRPCPVGSSNSRPMADAWVSVRSPVPAAARMRRRSRPITDRTCCEACTADGVASRSSLMDPP